MPDQKRWTLMFYLASDNPLAPGVITQLKAIKAAGFHKRANVIVQFDPYTEDTPTHVFDVNMVRKLRSEEESDIGFRSNDPYVHSLVEDKLWRDEKDRNGTLIREQLMATIPNYNPALPPNGTLEDGSYKEPGPKKSLENFLSFCANSYPAEHYILFVLGHGVVVGNDVFLFDEHADEQTLSLGGLREVLVEFNKQIKNKGCLELVSFHSCSVSSVEVAFELKDMARYMLASQAPSYIGSLPYREILIRIFNSLNPEREAETIESMLMDILYYCLHNSKDFLLAGYPYDICLSRLGGPIAELKAAIDELAGTLIRGLDVRGVKEAIQLSHLKAQSFQSELYTDISDFCRCLFVQISQTTGSEESENIRTQIRSACRNVIHAFAGSIEKSVYAGSEYQYSKGLSIYFPWSKPADYLMKRYGDYTFAGSEQKSWLNFLQEYFSTTMRDTIRDELANPIADLGETPAGRQANRADDLLEDQLALVYTQAAWQASPYALDKPKTDVRDPMGTCTCASIKNYPRDTRRRPERKKAYGMFALDPDFLQ
jgi:hypothetical protein